jgi:acid phosphatase family membrane protein YuiD
MDYLIVTTLSLIFGRLINFTFRYFSKTKDSKNIFWVFVWATGAPSIHSAILVSNLTLLHRDIGFSSVFMFSLIVSLILMYNLVADREREIIRGETGRVLDISGHSFFDILTGVIFGLVIGVLFIFLK